MLPVSVLIVNYNGAKHLPRCLAALERQSLPRHRFEVIVVDNASRDGSADLVPPWVRLVRLTTNVGFAEGNNVAARHAHGDTFVLLNNDTEPDPFWLEELLRDADSPAVASKLVFDHDPTTINSGGLYLLRDGRGADLGFRQRDAGQFETERPTFAGCGAALAVKADGDVFPADYFMYYEDLDTSWRRQSNGQPGRYIPRSLVRHVHGAAAGDASPLFRFYVERNRALTSLRNADLFLAVVSGLGLCAKVAQAWVRMLIGQHGVRHATAVSRALGSYLLRLPRTLVERYRIRVEEGT